MARSNSSRRQAKSAAISPAEPATESSGVLRVVDDAVCAVCGCACDDIQLHVEGQRITRAENACELARPWFLACDNVADDAPGCRVDGRPATVEEGIERAGAILRDARWPLVCGLAGATVEAQCAATSVAEAIGGLIDGAGRGGQRAAGLSFHRVAEVTATLGELRHRADVVVFWQADPATTHPRHLERYSLHRSGRFVPGGRADRYCVMIGSQRMASADQADEVMLIKPDGDFEALWTLRAIVGDIDVDADKVERQTGVDIERWRALVERMKHARYVALLYGSPLTTARGAHVNADALLALVRDLNEFTRCVSLPMLSPGDATGAETALVWRTGFPRAVSLTQGYPRFSPGEYDAETTLARREADAALVLDGTQVAQLGPAASRHLASIPWIAIDAQDHPVAGQATVWFRAATPGISQGGTIYRHDGVPIELRRAVDSAYPPAQDLLARIDRRVRERS